MAERETLSEIMVVLAEVLAPKMLVDHLEHQGREAPVVTALMHLTIPAVAVGVQVQQAQTRTVA